MLDLLSPGAQAALFKAIDERVAEALSAAPAQPARMSPWFTVEEAADYLRTSPDAIRKRIDRGQLKSHRPEGSRILLHEDDLNVAGPRHRGVL